MLKEYEASGKTVDEAIDAACALANTTIDMVEVEVLEYGSKGLFGIGAKSARVKVIVEAAEPAAPAAPAKADEAAAPAFGSFGTKKTKKERFEQKTKKTQEVEIKPIIIAETMGTVIEDEKSRPARRRNNRPQREDRDQQRSRDSFVMPTERERSEAAAERQRRESRAYVVTEGEMANNITSEAMLFLLPIFDKLQIEPQINTSVHEGILWISFSGQNMGLLIGRRGETLDALQYLTNLVVNKKHKEHVRIILNVEGYREGREETLVSLAHKMADKAVKTGRRVELKPMNPHERRVVHIALQDDKRVETVSHGEEPYRRVIISCKRPRRDRKPRHNGAPRAFEGGAETVKPQVEQPIVVETGVEE